MLQILLIKFFDHFLPFLFFDFKFSFLFGVLQAVCA